LARTSILRPGLLLKQLRRLLSNPNPTSSAAVFPPLPLSVSSSPRRHGQRCDNLTVMTSPSQDRVTRS
jgi:hypothetical protein